MRIGYVVPDLTHLRYYIPVCQQLAALGAADQAFHLFRDSSKYNGLANEENFRLCAQLLDENCPFVPIYDGHYDDNYDIVIQVEGGDRLRCDRRIALQHGFDFVYRSMSYDNLSCYVCSNGYSAEHATRYGVPNPVVAPIPPSLWRYVASGVANSLDAAIVFYPDQGQTDIANHVIEELTPMCRQVLVKQRKKHQAISGGGTHVFDQVWFPSESMVIPLTCRLTVGFGSTAYVDLVEAGVTYVNIDLQHGSFPFNAFPHPIAPNYTRVTDPENVIPAVRAGIYHEKQVLPTFASTELQVHDFVRGLLAL